MITQSQSPQIRFFFPALAITALAYLTLAAADAAEYTRITGASAAGNWSDSDKWTPSGPPSAITDGAIINTDDTTERAINLTSDETIAFLRVGYASTAGLTATSNVSIGGADSYHLNIGDNSTGGQIVVGGGSASMTHGANGRLSIGSNVAVNVAGPGSIFYIGAATENFTNTVSTPVTGVVTMSSDATLNLGSSNQRSSWIVGRQNNGRTASVSSGTFTATGGDVTAWLSDFVIGQNVRGASNTDTHRGIGYVDFSGLDSASVVTTNLTVGQTAAANASSDGTLILGNGSNLAIATVNNGSLDVGVRSAGTGSGTTINNAYGKVTIGNGASFVIGSDTTRAAANIGVNAGTRGSDIISDGRITASTNSSFSGYFSSLIIGSQTATSLDKTFRATGVLDLRNATIDAFDVSGDALIGNGAGQGSQGELRLSEVNGRIGGNLTVGDTKTGGSPLANQVTSYGILQLVGAQLSVEGNVNLLETGQTLVTVLESQAGLHLGLTSTLTISKLGSSTEDPLAGYHIDFQEPLSPAEGLYYGFAWDGNHLSTVNDLVSNKAITWTSSLTGADVGVFYNSDLHLTYIGYTVVPEPATYLLLGATGFAGFLYRRRSMRNKR